jgi:hypothetical protein
MGSRSINLDELRVHLNDARDRISLEKQEILKLYPLSDGFNREEYAFAYIRAERAGMRAINRKLSEIAWLPMQLDPKAEIMAEGHASMKRWLTSAVVGKPDSEEFGNDFIHALARCGMKHGWEHPEIVRLSSRVASLFRDLSCLIGLIYYCTWLTENSVEDVQLSNPDDLTRSAEEIAALIQSPELYRYLRAKEQDIEKAQTQPGRRGLNAGLAGEDGAKNGPHKRKARPTLRVIENENYFDPFMPDPVMV